MLTYHLAEFLKAYCNEKSWDSNYHMNKMNEEGEKTFGFKNPFQEYQIENATLDAEVNWLEVDPQVIKNLAINLIERSVALGQDLDYALNKLFENFFAKVEGASNLKPEVFQDLKVALTDVIQPLEPNVVSLTEKSEILIYSLLNYFSPEWFDKKILELEGSIVSYRETVHDDPNFRRSAFSWNGGFMIGHYNNLIRLAKSYKVIVLVNNSL